jgi:hypothetical protein
MSKSTSKLFGNEEREVKQEVKEEAVEVKEPELPAEKEEEPLDLPAEAEPEDDIQDIEIKAIKKQRFRFNHDNSMILELNTSDMNIFTRLESSYRKLNAIMEDVAKLLSEIPDEENFDEDNLSTVSDALKKLDDSMKKEVDYIFDAPVSSVLCRDGSMYDPLDGMFRYEHIIDVLADKYENHLSREFAKMRQNVDRRTNKYTKKYHR